MACTPPEEQTEYRSKRETFNMDLNLYFFLTLRISPKIGQPNNVSLYFRYLRNVSIPYNQLSTDDATKDRPSMTFKSDGTRSDIELKIVNLRDTPGGHNTRTWEEVSYSL